MFVGAFTFGGCLSVIFDSAIRSNPSSLVRHTHKHTALHLHAATSMGSLRDDGSTSSLIHKSTIMVTEDDATTVHNDMRQTITCVQEDYGCGGISCHHRELQLPAMTKTIYESWTLAYHRPTVHVVSQLKSFCIFEYLKTTTVPGRVMSIEPQTQFGQKQLAEVVDCVRDQHKPKLFSSINYDKDVETRLRKLDWTVQDELYKLIRDRTENASNMFRRREYKLVVLLEVPGAEMTDAGTGAQSSKRWCRMMRKLKRTKAPMVEYRVILRGSEVMNSDAGWGVYDRYAQPWKLADEAELADAREKSGYQEILN